jgi:hypothetical protein
LGCCGWTFDVKMNVKASFFDVVCEVKKDLQNVSAGIGVLKKYI